MSKYFWVQQIQLSLINISQNDHKNPPNIKWQCGNPTLNRLDESTWKSLEGGGGCPQVSLCRETESNELVKLATLHSRCQKIFLTRISIISNLDPCHSPALTHKATSHRGFAGSSLSNSLTAHYCLYVGSCSETQRSKPQTWIKQRRLKCKRGNTHTPMLSHTCRKILALKHWCPSNQRWERRSLHKQLGFFFGFSQFLGSVISGDTNWTSSRPR